MVAGLSDCACRLHPFCAGAPVGNRIYSDVLLRFPPSSNEIGRLGSTENLPIRSHLMFLLIVLNNGLFGSNHCKANLRSECALRKIASLDGRWIPQGNVSGEKRTARATRGPSGGLL